MHGKLGMVLLANFAAIILLVLPSAGRAAPRTDIFIFGQGTADKAAEARYGSETAPAIYHQLSFAVAMELDRQYPCHGSLTMSDVGNLLGLARMRELLGENSEAQMNALASVGGAIGARYAVDVRVRMIGGQVFVSSTMIDISSGRTVARDTASIAFGSPTADDELNRFAKRFAGSLGSVLPKCPSKDWKGTVSVTSTLNKILKNSAGRDVDDNGESQLTCQLTGEGSNARCSYSSSYVTKGPGGSITTNKSAKDAGTSVSVSLGNGKLTLGIGRIRVMVDTRWSIPMPNFGTYEDSVDPGTFEVPAGSDPKSQSGQFTDPRSSQESGAKIVVTWNLTRG